MTWNCRNDRTLQLNVYVGKENVNFKLTANKAKKTHINQHIFVVVGILYDLLYLDIIIWKSWDILCWCFSTSTYFVYELAFFGMLDVVVVVFLFHSIVVRLHNVSSIRANYVAVYVQLFFVPNKCQHTKKRHTQRNK